MPNNKNHHYVPQFYLRNFSRDSKSVSLYNLRSNLVVSRASIKGQCQRSYLYGKNGKSEKSFADLEGVVSIIFRTIIDTGLPPRPFSGDHTALMFYVVTQHGRTIYAAEETNEFADKLAKHLVKPTLPRDGLLPEDLDRVKVVLTDPVGETLRHLVEAYPLVLDLHIVILRNDTSHGFITSDNPVVLYNQLLEERRYASNTGLQSVGLQIYLPISADCALLFFDSAAYGVGRRNPPTITLTNENDVKQLNALQYLNALHNVFFDDNRNLSAHIPIQFSNIRFRRRHHKTNLHSQVEQPLKPNQKRELIGFFREDVRNDMKLSFLKILKKAQKSKPELLSRIAVRNPALCNEFERYRQMVKAGKYSNGEFSKYIHEQANQAIDAELRGAARRILAATQQPV